MILVLRLLQHDKSKASSLKYFHFCICNLALVVDRTILLNFKAL